MLKTFKMFKSLRYLFEASFGETFPKATTYERDIISKVQNSQEYKDALKKEYLKSSNNSNSSNSSNISKLSNKLKKYIENPDTYFENVNSKSDLYTNKITNEPTTRKVPMRNLYKDIISKQYKAKVQGKNLSNDSSLLFPIMVKHNIHTINSNNIKQKGIQ